MEKDSKFLLNLIAQIISDKKGVNIVALDIGKLSSLTDYMIIAEGRIERHIKAIADFIIFELKKKKIFPYKVEGRMSGGWIVLDYSVVIVHLFVSNLREKYSLEKLWSKGKKVNLKIEEKNL
jgi:ribosome-associated protein